MGFVLFEVLSIAFQEISMLITRLMKFVKEDIMFVKEVCDNAEEYSKFNTNSIWQLISDMLKYLNDRIYTIDIVDVAVQACANALKVNLYIYERTGPKVILIPTYSRE